MNPVPSSEPRDDSQPRRSGVNPDLRGRRPGLRDVSADEYLEGLLSGDRVWLSRAITLVESTRPDHADLARVVIEGCLPRRGESIRVGITGVPGAGKSTLLDALGSLLLARGHRVAVLAVDPSSTRTRGSILGDKTRMARLASAERAYVRPSPTGGALGGVGLATREAILLCEAAGYDVVFVETVGVGQAEVTVRSMVDVFVLLALTGAGDQLQGIKRGIIEMADLLVVTKADGENVGPAEAAAAMYREALRLYPLPPSGVAPSVLTTSAETGEGLEALWEGIEAWLGAARSSDFFARQRKEQALDWLDQALDAALKGRFLAREGAAEQLRIARQQVAEGLCSPITAARHLIERTDAPGPA